MPGTDGSINRIDPPWVNGPDTYTIPEPGVYAVMAFATLGAATTGASSGTVDADSALYHDLLVNGTQVATAPLQVWKYELAGGASGETLTRSEERSSTITWAQAFNAGDVISNAQRFVRADHIGTSPPFTARLTVWKIAAD